MGEAQEGPHGEKLGPVGSRIVMETFVGLMLGDSHSYLRQDPLWTPDAVRKGGRKRGKFGMAEFIKVATAASE